MKIFFLCEFFFGAKELEVCLLDPEDSLLQQMLDALVANSENIANISDLPFYQYIYDDIKPDRLTNGGNNLFDPYGMLVNSHNYYVNLTFSMENDFAAVHGTLLLGSASPRTDQRSYNRAGISRK